MSTLTAHQIELIDRISALKKEKNAVILVHNYLRPELYEVADVVGDSLALCEEAAVTSADIVVFAAVHFMAESAALLLPDKKVLLPNYNAGCALADMITAEQLREWKLQYPGSAVVCYINSSAEVKAESDVVCTSSNAVAVTRALPQKQILFVPDKNLAAFVAKQVPEKEIIAWDGYCPIHHKITAETIVQLKLDHPRAKIIAHPECTEEVLRLADEVASTSGMVSFAQKSSHDEFVVITECGLTARMKQLMPEKRFLSACNLCYDMKKTTLESVLDSLLEEQFLIEVPEAVAFRARKSFVRMFELTRQTSRIPSLVT